MKSSFNIINLYIASIVYETKLMHPYLLVDTVVLRSTLAFSCFHFCSIQVFVKHLHYLHMANHALVSFEIQILSHIQELILTWCN
jgi:hypothetical protein